MHFFIIGKCFIYKNQKTFIDNSFRTLARNRIRRAFYSYGQLPDTHKRLVPNYESHLAQLLKCIDQK